MVDTTTQIDEQAQFGNIEYARIHNFIHIQQPTWSSPLYL